MTKGNKAHRNTSKTENMERLHNWTKPDPGQGTRTQNKLHTNTNDINTWKNDEKNAMIKNQPGKNYNSNHNPKPITTTADLWENHILHLNIIDGDKKQWKTSFEK